ncbi:Predicted dehydrogenase [Tistlia consotensis]|uniref:Predicted dehydrogenase n=1 Tax=Tistlia consotensis USBA 355 TaxID=560819 RepID=A0A1Y6BHP2_9PROT|nr:Gfo/Idh/MocA family oxidoreductase [Tistlia consotensis]SMF12026.1 Predicted dehydrogenase [Tistlia consotensis USBA 355]SNR51421.1 Predicted dehydrogenase [Tistlia consotensis]
MRPLEIGVIGAGMIGRKHIERILAHPDFELAGIADPERDVVAARYPGERVVADHRALLAEARPDAVIIASPNRAHAETGIDCARSGVHILVEKPVADTVEAAARLVEESRRAGIKTLVGHHRRHHRQVQVLRGLLGAGEIGRLVGVSVVWAVYKPEAYFEAGPWRREPGGGPILINLIHEIDLLRYLVGEIAAVGAMASNSQRGFAVEDTAAALLEFAEGALATVVASDSAVSPWSVEQGTGEVPDFPFSGESSYRFFGSLGALEFPDLVRWSQPGGPPSWNRAVLAQRLPAPTLDPYVAQLDHFRDVIRGEADSLQSVEDGTRTLIATLAVSEAAGTGARIDLRPRYEALAAGSAGFAG